MPYVYSTATCGSIFCDYAPCNDPNRDAIILKRVEIKGGHNVATQFRHSNFAAVHTPIGVATYVSDEELEFLERNDSFQEMVKNGFLSVDKRKVDPEIRVKGMKDKDASAPLTPKDFEAGDNSDELSPTYKKKK